MNRNAPLPVLALSVNSLLCSDMSGVGDEADIPRTLFKRRGGRMCELFQLLPSAYRLIIRRGLLLVYEGTPLLGANMNSVPIRS